jgi:hypothetical protein
MATKEDILEQIVEEYLVHKGYFVQHNLKFLPRKDHPDFISNQDSNHSDIDVIGYHPLIEGDCKVMVVSCKSWQQGFNPASELDAIVSDKVRRGRKAWQAFRELTMPKWSEAFVEAVKDATGSDRFTYVTAVTRLAGDKSVWEAHEPFSQAIGGNPVTILTFREMVLEIQGKLTTTLAATEVGRMLQLFTAADMKVAEE